MAEDDGDNDPLAGTGSVPPWVLRIVRDIAETKSGVQNLAGQIALIAARMDTFITRQEYERHVLHTEDVLKTKIDPLWDGHNAQLGEQKNQQRYEKWWRFGLASAIAILTLWALLRQARVL